MNRAILYSMIAAAMAFALRNGTLSADEPSGLEAAAAVESAFVKTIATAERSVVAIARVRKEQPGDSVRKEFRPAPLGNEMAAPIDRLHSQRVRRGRGGRSPRTGPHRRARAGRRERRLLHYDLPTACLSRLDQGRRSTQRPGRFEHRRGGRRVGQPVADQPGRCRPAPQGTDHCHAGQPVRDRSRWPSQCRLGHRVQSRPQGIDRIGRRALDEEELASQPLLQRFGGLIQTDARLHLGTSGGPLLNLKGEMVGLCISTAAIAGYESPAGYAIPVDEMFRRVLDVLKQGREVEYGLLGVEPSDLTTEEIAAGRHGVRAPRFYASLAAARAGLREDDIITSVNGRPIYDSDGYALEVGRLPVEAVARLGVLHGNGEPVAGSQTIEVVLGKFPVRRKKDRNRRPGRVAECGSITARPTWKPDDLCGLVYRRPTTPWSFPTLRRTRLPPPRA